MVGVVDLDENFFVRFTVFHAPGADHFAEDGPIVLPLFVAVPMDERHRRSVQGEQAAAVADERLQIFSQIRIRKNVADRVVEHDGVEVL